MIDTLQNTIVYWLCNVMGTKRQINPEWLTTWELKLLNHIPRDGQYILDTFVSLTLVNCILLKSIIWNTT